MRFMYGVLALILWCILVAYTTQGIVISNEIQLLSAAIIVAGAMAGGD